MVECVLLSSEHALRILIQQQTLLSIGLLAGSILLACLDAIWKLLQ